MKEDSEIALNESRVDSGTPVDLVKELRVDGGASANNLLMQFQADILQVPVVRPQVIETTALGAAYLAGLATGVWRDRDEVQHAWKADRVFEPRMSADEAAHRRSRWAEALKRAREWEERSRFKGQGAITW
jgi:glycerol kinase